MENLENVMKLVDNEIDTITKNGKFRSREEIMSMGALIDMKKDICGIWKDEEEMYDDDGASYRGGRSMRGYSRGGDYEGSSYARGRRNARRDSMGRYTSGSYRGDYSRGDSKEEYIDHLREMMQDAPDEQTRRSIHNMIQQMESK